VLKEPPDNRHTTIQIIISFIPLLASHEKNSSLLCSISFVEVTQTVKDMASRKLPGSYGFTTYFFQSCWSVVGKEVWEVMEDSRVSRNILQYFNSTFVTLIPKYQSANMVDNFMPISLSNSIYKTITKIIVNHLKPIMAKTISQEHWGYVEGRKYWMVSLLLTKLSVFFKSTNLLA
jgi:hypothetical protein